MWGIQQSIRAVVALGQRGRSGARRPGRRDASATDWLPPVMDLGDWSGARMADRSAGWYFDRD